MNGYGWFVSVLQTQRTPFGLMQTQTVCPDCMGSGEVIADKCDSCGGRGVVQMSKQIKIDIPAGVQVGGGVTTA